MTPADLEQVCARLLTAQRDLAALSTDEIIAAIDGAAHRLQQPDTEERVRVLHSLQEVSGFSPQMAAHLLDRLCNDWKRPALQRLVRAEFGEDDPFAGFTPEHVRGSRVRAIAPPLGFHIFSGNVPGVGVTSVVRSLLVRSAVLGKPAAGEPALTAVFADLLRQENEAVGRAVEIIYWKGGDRELEDVPLRHASLVVHYGAAESIRDLRARAGAHVNVLEHGPRISFAIIRPDASPTGTDALAAQTARAVALFDQQGCVSPQIAWVIGTREDARRFAVAVSDELARLQNELPRGSITPAEAAAIRELRTRTEFASADTSVWGPDDLRYTVVLGDGTAMEGSCLNRTLIVKAAPRVENVIAAVRPFRDVLQTAGVGGFVERERDDLADALAAVGVSRVTSIGDMPWPPPWWHHDGRGPLRELVRWVDLEG